MDIEVITGFFMWCTIINGSLLVITTLIRVLVPGPLYKLQTIIFKIDREIFDIVFYSFIGAFKILFLMFNLVPYLALIIIS